MLFRGRGSARGGELTGLFGARGLALASALGAGPESVYLGDRAREGRLRTMDLSGTRVVAFATHGLVAGELDALAEPALVLTPPAAASAADDGLLTASEVALLDLDAEWVILSACNTASGDGRPGADALSGLAKAFFYAGTRALLVSHWPVWSEAAVPLTTRMLREASVHPERGRAQALRQSMLALMADATRPYHAHPKFWGPFVVVGEGSAPGKSQSALARPVVRGEASAASASLAVPPKGPARVRLVQALLAERGYDPGPADGVMGRRTRAAIGAFEAAHGLTVTGRISPGLLAGLAGEP